LNAFGGSASQAFSSTRSASQAFSSTRSGGPSSAQTTHQARAAICAQASHQPFFQATSCYTVTPTNHGSSQRSANPSSGQPCANNHRQNAFEKACLG
jgi:hypothetical protein